MASQEEKINIAQLPEKVIATTDYLPIVTPDGKTRKGLVSAVVDAVQLQVEESGAVAEMVVEAEGILTQLREESAAEYEIKGNWNPATNTPTLTANSSTGQTGDKYQEYDITPAGAAPFSGIGFTSGDVIGPGKLRGTSTNQWRYVAAGVPNGSVDSDKLDPSVAVKNLPFAPTAVPTTLLKNAILDIQLINLTANRYVLASIKKNVSTLSAVQIYDAIGEGVGSELYSWDKTSYSFPSTPEWIELKSPTGVSGAFIKIDWTQVPNGTSQLAMPYSVSGISNVRNSRLPFLASGLMPNKFLGVDVATKQLPFQPAATLHPSLVCVKDLRLPDFSPNKQYALGIVRRTTTDTLFRLYDWTANNFGPRQYEWRFQGTTYVPASNIETLILKGDGKFAELTVDWSLLPMATDSTSMGYTVAGISPLAITSFVNNAKNLGGVGPGSDTIQAYGDSIIDANSVGLANSAGTGGATSTVAFSNLGFMNWANFLSGFRFQFIADDGVSGQRTDEILARMLANGLVAKTVIVEGGVNDINAGITSAVIIANLTAMYDYCIARGVNMIVMTITPVSTWTVAQRLKMREVNAFIVKWVIAKKNVYLFDANRVITDPSSVTMQPKAGKLYDTTHPGAGGSYDLGKELAKIYRFISANEAKLSVGASDSYDTAENPYQLIKNVAFTGTTGTKTNWTGNMPTDWVGTSAGGSGQVISVGLDAEGYPEITVTMTATAIGNRVVFKQDLPTSLLINGATFYGQCKIEIVNPVNTRSVGLELGATIDGATFTRSFLRDSSGAAAATAGFIPESCSGVLQTPELKGTGGTVTVFAISVQAEFIAAGSVTLKIKQPRVVQVI